MSLVSRSEYARHRKVDPSLVTRWAKNERIVTNGKMIDLEQSDRLLAATLDPARGGRGGRSDRIPPAGSSGSTAPDAQQRHPTPAGGPSAQERATGNAPTPDAYTRVRTHREAFAAKTAEAEYRKMIGELVESDGVKRALSDNLAPALQRLESMSARLGARVAAEIDVRRCQDIIDEEVTSIRQEIADNVRAMIDGLGKTRQ